MFGGHIGVPVLGIPFDPILQETFFMKRQCAAILLAGLFAHPAMASSDDAWKQFVSEVQAKCLGATADMIENGKVVVDPFGSQSYGLAIVSGKAKGAEAQISHICVYDKVTKNVEVGSELTTDAVDISIKQ
jgi:hypothetical protein